MQKGLSNPFNYTGSKFRYLAELAEILPTDKNLTVCDPFLGGGDLCMHLPDDWTIHASDALSELVGMHQYIQTAKITVISVLRDTFFYSLDKESTANYYDLRKKYNLCIASGQVAPDLLYLLLCHSNTNRIRFSSNDQFNMPFGKRTFNPSMQNKLDDYIERLSRKSIVFAHRGYEKTNFADYDLTLLDPPYLFTDATYTMGKKWTEKSEAALHKKINTECKKFVYFGQLWAKGNHNHLLQTFMKDHQHLILKDTTKGCSNNRKGGKTVEVMIWNF
jgi:DNA adenine methylase